MFICVFGVGVGIWLRYGSVLVGRLCNLWRIVRQLGSRSLVISWLQMSGMGLYTIMKVYSWWWVGYFERVELCRRMCGSSGFCGEVLV